MNLSVCRTEHQHVDLLPAGHGTEPGTAPAVFSLRLSEGRQSTLGEVWKQKIEFSLIVFENYVERQMLSS
jgi:hypothetical protein